MKPWNDQEARWIRRAVEDVVSERRPPGHELTAEDYREAMRLTVNQRLAGEARDLETYRIVCGQLARLYAGSYIRWVRGCRLGAGTRIRTLKCTSTAVRGLPLAGETMEDLTDRTILVTGATDGLGRRVASGLAGRGATVLLHGRDRGRSEATLEEIREETGNEEARYYLADLSSLGEVRALAHRILAEHDRLDALVNNAGVIVPERRESEDGVELTFAVNHLSHFVLTSLLLPLLRDSAPARVVNIASAGQSPVDFGDVMLERGYDPMRAYTQSKLAQVMFTFSLAERLSGSGVTTNALHPATLMDTKMVRKTFGYATSTLEEGVEATLRLATSPEVKGITGRYFDGRREAHANRQAYDAEARERLWTLSEEACGRLLEPLRAGGG